jgi:precorrin-6B methylase 2
LENSTGGTTEELMTLTDKDLTQRLAEQPWTAHNIRFTPGVVAMPGRPDFKSDIRLKAILSFLSILYKDELTGLRLADLGCLEGGFALELAQRGMIVTGVEAREKNLKKCRLLEEHFALPNLKFVRDDAKNFSRENYGTFDVVLALGILYHLDDPLSWLCQIAETSKTLLVIESHYAPENEKALALLDPDLRQLGPIERIEYQGTTYEGRWFFEYGPEHDPENQLWASYSNARSFWLTKESILRVTKGAGFDLVLEDHTYSANNYRFFNSSRARGMYLAIKTNPVVSK